ncbi:YkgJ family cysteine cluster protein [Phnomibacter ginsenosidimutans]|uniref:YkgJ family cysteine cluster protein n=1 Tax=Phnomibacter ginsenosidimutans TaxID=2676868 RepID=UPI001FE62FFC|nr:YkgJ family cysteine cluster protein [Phnomibacter ginsenosidimutans]
MANELPQNWQKKAAENQKKYKHWLQKVEVRKVLKVLPEVHEAVFEEVDCLSCAACCKNYSPRFKTPDIKRISKVLRMKESAFIDTYLRLDDEGDYVVKQSPCPFLGADNFCSIYEDRPSDCSRFPYTDEDVLLAAQKHHLEKCQLLPGCFCGLGKTHPALSLMTIQQLLLL